VLIKIIYTRKTILHNRIRKLDLREQRKYKAKGVVAILGFEYHQKQWALDLELYYE
jgi:hypothetical protein